MQQHQIKQPIFGLPQDRNHLVPRSWPKFEGYYEILADIPTMPNPAQHGVAHRIARVLAYMLQNLDKPLKISTLAVLANVSPSHFFALFKRFSGSSPMHYFTKMRMFHACQLLDSTEPSIKEVSAAIGYNDPLYFSRVFKSFSAVAPVHYRKLSLALKLEIREMLLPKEPIRNVVSPRFAACWSKADPTNQIIPRNKILKEPNQKVIT